MTTATKSHKRNPLLDDSPPDPRVVARELVRATRSAAESREVLARFAVETRYGRFEDVTLRQRLADAESRVRLLRGTLAG